MTGSAWTFSVHAGRCVEKGLPRGGVWGGDRARLDFTRGPADIFSCLFWCLFPLLCFVRFLRVLEGSFGPLGSLLAPFGALFGAILVTFGG